MGGRILKGGTVSVFCMLIGLTIPQPRSCPEGYYEVPASEKSIIKCLPYVSPPDPNVIV